MLRSFDVLLIALALVVMVAGFSRRRALWWAGRSEERSPSPGFFLVYLLGHKRILQRRMAGSLHLLVFWAVVGPLFLVILAQFGLTLPGGVARVLSLLTDLLGLALLLGTGYFLIKRVGKIGEKTSKGVLLPLILLLLILVTGFAAEGVRLRIVPVEAAWSTPVGGLLSTTLPPSPLLMQWMIRLHFFAVLSLIALLPFTFLRHLVAASLNVLYKGEDHCKALRTPSLENGPISAGEVRDFTWKQLLDSEACVSCGRCEENCPAFLSGKPLSPLKVIQHILEHMEASQTRNGNGNESSGSSLRTTVSDDEIWACTACMACVETCPVFIEPMDRVIAMRRYRVMEEGRLPPEAQPLFRNLEIFGDVYGKGPAYRRDWALHREVPLRSKKGDAQDILLWVGCSGAFHPRYVETTRAFVEILRRGGVEFGVLGGEEGCCGDPARRLGEESLYRKLAQENIRFLQRREVQRIVTLCPHCFNTLKNEYPTLGGVFQVFHATHYVLQLIEERRIRLKYPLNHALAVHDPCYLGRANQIYEPLRRIAAAVPGLEMRELPRNREKSFCCGGGGGRMWLHEELGDHIGHLRAKEVWESGVTLVGTACPYCMIMLDDGLKALEAERTPEVRDIIEIVAGSMA